MGEIKIESTNKEYFVAGGNIAIDSNFKKFCREKELNLLQLPPLSPQCSPLYYIYQDIKNTIRQNK